MTTAVRAELVDAVFSFKPLGSRTPVGRGLPGGNSLSFCVAKKKVSKEKGDPMVWVPPLRYGQPAVLAENGAELELAFGSDNRPS
ncbi:MAG: hypothetical protein V4593_07660 [Pseudomonadota bacterium]